MFYASTDIEETLKCSFCQFRFSDSIKLIHGCGESICGECYEDLMAQVDETGSFECKSCSGSHTIPEGGFVDNKGLLRLLEKEMKEKPLSDQARILRDQIDSLHHQFSELKSFDDNDHVNVHCDYLECQVIDAVESVIKQFNAIKGVLLKQVQEYRARSLKSIVRGLDTTRTESSDDIAQQIEELARDLGHFNDKWDDYFKRVEALSSDIDITNATKRVKDFRSRINSLANQKKMTALKSKVMVLKSDQTIFENLKSYLTLEIQEKLKEEMSLGVEPLQITMISLKPVKEVLFLPDEKLASFSDGKHIKIWNVVDGQQLFELKGHSGKVNSMALLPNGYLASSSFDSTIKIWNLNEGKEIMTLEISEFFTKLQGLSDTRLASFSHDGLIKIWDTSKRKLLLTIREHQSNSLSCKLFSLSPDGNLVTGSCDAHDEDECVLKIWSSSDGKLLKTLSTGIVGAHSLLALSNGQIALGFKNGTIKIMDLTDDAKSRTKENAHSTRVGPLSQLPNGYLVSSDYFSNYLIKIWNVVDMSLIQEIRTGHNSRIESLSLSPDGTLLASGSDDKTIKLWPITRFE